MTTGPDGDRRPEPTFADVMNGFGLDSGRPVRRRLFGRRRGGGAAEADPRDAVRPAAPAAPPPSPAAGFDRYGDPGPGATLQVEHRAVAELCEQTRSVAEVAALLSLPLGVARVVLGDMAGLGVVTVHQTASSAGSAPDLALMERVLSGLRRL